MKFLQIDSIYCFCLQKTNIEPEVISRDTATVSASAAPAAVPPQPVLPSNGLSPSNHKSSVQSLTDAHDVSSSGS